VTRTHPRPLLLVVDDDRPVLRIVERIAAKTGFTSTCGSGTEAMQALMPRRSRDARSGMPDVNGLDLLRQIRGGAELRGYPDDGARRRRQRRRRSSPVRADPPPPDFDRPKQLLTEIREEFERRAQVAALESQVARQLEFYGMLGRSPVMQEVFSLIQRLAPHAKVVLISGETGTGKELAARAFHQAGTRRHKPFVTINCSAVVDTLFESELFGHVRGAFTGAVESKPGVFESRGGTLFLDEVGELPMSVQAKLLRALMMAKCSGGIAAAEEGRRHGGCRHQPRSPRGSRRRPFSRRLVLSSQRRRRDAAAAARSP
jgi:DNA-binding NtrC family response regulator